MYCQLPFSAAVSVTGYRKEPREGSWATCWILTHGEGMTHGPLLTGSACPCSPYISPSPFPPSSWHSVYNRFIVALGLEAAGWTVSGSSVISVSSKAFRVFRSLSL